MRMLIAFMIALSLCLSSHCHSEPPQQTKFIIFSNDGTFYKFDPIRQHVDWHSDLGQNLLHFQLAETNPQLDTSQQSNETYFVPTVEGNFIYIDRHKEVLVHREEIEHLLDVCLGSGYTEISSEYQEGGVTESKNNVKFFLHDKFEYYFIDLHNGQLWTMEDFFRSRIMAKSHRHALIKVSKKFLKQLSSDLTVKWSSISSTIDIVSAVEFLQNPNIPILSSLYEKEQEMRFEFRRITANEIEVFDKHKDKGFHIGGSSSVMSIISYNFEQSNNFQKYPFVFEDKKVLAIEDKTMKRKSGQSNMISGLFDEITRNIGNPRVNEMNIKEFPISQQYRNVNRMEGSNDYDFKDKEVYDFEYCVNSFRAIQKLSNRDRNTVKRFPFNLPDINGRIFPTNNREYIPNALPTPQISPTSHPHFFEESIKEKEQPYIWVFILIAVLGGGFVLYRLKVNKLLNELEKLETTHDRKFEEIQKKLGKFEEMQKMYEIYWDKMLLRRLSRKASDSLASSSTNEKLGSNDEKQNSKSVKSQIEPQIFMYEYLVFEGRFLNKDALVYAVPIQGIDLIHIEHQLNDLLSCSHRNLVKLYYYTKNSEFLLIFCQKIEPFWQSVDICDLFGHEKKSARNLLQKNNEHQKVTPLKNSTNTDQSVEEKKRWAFKQTSVKYQKGRSYDFNEKICEVIECLTYLDTKIELFSLPLESVIINEKLCTSSQKQISSNETQKKTYSLKINVIPCLFQVYRCEDNENGSSQNSLHEARARQFMGRKIRFDLVKLFYFLNSKGTIPKKLDLNQCSKKQNEDQQNFFVNDFYDFILNESYSVSNITEIVGQTPEEKELSKDRQGGSVVGRMGLNQNFLMSLQKHPFLWSSKRKMLFLSDFSNYVETHLDDSKLKKMQAYSKDYNIVDTPWNRCLDSIFVKEVNSFRKYDFNSVRDLIRLIRNKVNHFHEMPKQVRMVIGKTPEQFIDYMLNRFPKLLSFAFVYSQRKKWKLHVQ